MDIASLVLGIISIVFGAFPFCGTFFALPALVGLILGVVFLATAKRHKKPRGMAIAGTATSAIALLVMASWWLSAVFNSEFTTSTDGFNMNSSFDAYEDSTASDEIKKELQQFDEDTIQWDDVEDSSGL